MHDNFKSMEDVVSVITEESEPEKFVNETGEESELSDKKELQTYGLSCKIKSVYRLIRKKLSSVFKYHIKKTCTEILYITDGNVPDEYISAMQNRYPDKIITVLIPHFGNFKKDDRFVTEFSYFVRNKKHSAKLYKYQPDTKNINIYGIYSKIFSDITVPSDIYKTEFLVHYSVCARKAAAKLKPDIIHSENIPFFLGLEFSKNNKILPKVLQTIHNFDTYSDMEPFWAAINCLDKNGMDRLCKDNIIRKNLAALFGIKNINNFSKIKECLEYLYKNFELFRKTYNKDEETNENILIKRLNARTVELFSFAFPQDMFSPVYFSIKNSYFSALNSKDTDDPIWAKDMFKRNHLRKGKNRKFSGKIAHPFDVSNFRYYRDFNKQYLVKEFAEKQINTKFVDLNLFSKDEVKIYGFLDSFYKGALLFADFHNMKDEDIKIVTNSVLKCFELKKNIQVIFNLPFNFENTYIKSFIDFLEQQPSLNGKWLLIEGEINLPQFTASCDMILFPTSNIIGVEDVLYTALQYGCIPITTNSGICGDIVVDIFDNIKTGFGFKNSNNVINNEQDTFTNTLLKGLNFYVQNFSSWKILIENAIKFDTSWNNELLEEYNKIYDDAL